MLYILNDQNTPGDWQKRFFPLFVIGGDHHIHAWKQGDWTQRIQNSASVLEQGIMYAKEYGVPFILNGDLTHDKNALNPHVTEVLVQIFERWKDEVVIFLVVGNHERPDKYGMTNTLACFSSLVHVVSDFDCLPLNVEPPMQLCMAPFVYDHKAMSETIRKVLDNSQSAPRVKRILCGHYPVTGAELNGIRLDTGVLLEDFFPQAFEALLFSDIHKHQVINEKACHLGLTHQNNFGEAGYDYGWWLCGVWDNNPEWITIKRLKVNAPEFRTVTDAQDAAQAGEVADGDFVREAPQTVISRTLDTIEGPRLLLDRRDMFTTVKQFLGYKRDKGLLDPHLLPDVQTAALSLFLPEDAPGAR